MNVAVLHYHLKRGGVTRVVANHLHALHTVAKGQGGEPIHLAVFHGGETSGWPTELPADTEQVRHSLHELPALQYNRPLAAANDIETQLLHEFQQLGWRRENTLLHIHNHSLGKSLALPQTVLNLAEAGWRMLLQIHDFAEDFRPDNYRYLAGGAGGDVATLVYPSAAHVHYAVLNGRDYQALSKAGVGAANLHSLPNPVTPFANLPPRQAARKLAGETFGIPDEATLAVYPVRGIARKNLGEALLYAALGEGKLHAGVTLAPTNPQEQPQYENWRSLGEELKLPFVFGLGDEGGLDFLQNIAAADALLTTSVAEGFGMVFLEASFADAPLIGRDLPEITADFREVGMQFPHLRKQLLIPLQWPGADAVRQAITNAYVSLRQAYDLPALPEATIAEQCERMLAGGLIDFAILDQQLQRKVIERVATDHASREKVFELNPGLHAAIFGTDAQAGEQVGNRAAASERFSSEAIGKRLIQLYETVGSAEPSPVTTLANADALLDFFLDMQRMNLIRL